MEITKFSHSCVRIEHEGAVLVVDPGVWSEPDALLGADAVLVTHEHADHVDERRLRGLEVPVFAPLGAAIGGVPCVPVRPGQAFQAAGLEVTTHGGRHAEVVPGQDVCANLGYLIAGTVYAPGDALTLPDAPVQTLLVPMQASWLKTAEAMDFLRKAAPERAFGVHDGQINERAIDSITGWLARVGPFEWLAPGSVR